MPVNGDVNDETHDHLEREFEDYDADTVASDADEWVEQAPAPTADSGEAVAFELYRNDDGGWRWRLVDEDGTVLAESGGSYAERVDAESAVATVKEDAGDAPVLADPQ